MTKQKFTLILILLLIPILTSCNNKQTDKVNLYSEEFTLTSLNGKQQSIDLTSFKGNPVVVNFWASWCGPCREEMPNLESSWIQHKDKGVVFLGINVLDDKSGAVSFIKENNVTFTNLYDHDGKLASSFNINSLPVTLFVDAGGAIIQKSFGGFIGDVGQKALRNNIKEIIN